MTLIMWFAVAAGLFAAIPGKTEDRRVSPVAPRPREGPLTEAIAGVQPRPRERVRMPHPCRSRCPPGSAQLGRVGMWRGGGRLGMSVAAPFVWRCLSGSAIAPFPHPSHRTQRADFPHCALGQDFTPSSTAGRVQAGSDARARRSRRGARVDSTPAQTGAWLRR